MSFVTSLRFFAPSLLGTSSLRADVAASVGDNFFCVNLKKFVCKRAYRVLLRSLRPSLEKSSRSRCSPPAPPLARDAIACSALEERAVYFISLSRRTLSTVLSSSSGERKWHPYAENVRPARVRQQLCPGVGLECQKKNYLPPSAFRRQPPRTHRPRG